MQTQSSANNLTRSVVLMMPNNDPEQEEIRNVFERVHQQEKSELNNLPDEELDVATKEQHPMYGTKFGALEWCAQHEFLHAGEIALLRRLLGSGAVW